MGVLAPLWGGFLEIFFSPHLIGQKIAKIHPSRQRFYNLFTKFNSPPTYKDKKMAKYPLVKNIPQLYAKKWGFGKVFWRMIYSLFTEIALENKNAPFSAK